MTNWQIDFANEVYEDACTCISINLLLVWAEEKSTKLSMKLFDRTL